MATVLADCAREGVHVRGLVWRSHPDEAHFSEEENLHLVRRSTKPAARCSSTNGSATRAVIIRSSFVLRHPDHPDDDVAFIGGIDLCHGRNDDDRHEGDPQAIEIDDRYGERPAVARRAARSSGPAVGDLAYTFRERWEDPTPVDHRNPVRARFDARRRTSRSGRIRCRRCLRDPRRVRHARGAGRADVSGPAAALSVRAGR